MRETEPRRQLRPAATNPGSSAKHRPGREPLAEPSLRAYPCRLHAIRLGKRGRTGRSSRRRTFPVSIPRPTNHRRSRPRHKDVPRTWSVTDDMRQWQRRCAGRHDHQDQSAPLRHCRQWTRGTGEQTSNCFCRSSMGSAMFLRKWGGWATLTQRGCHSRLLPHGMERRVLSNNIAS